MIIVCVNPYRNMIWRIHTSSQTYRPTLPYMTSPSNLPTPNYNRYLDYLIPNKMGGWGAAEILPRCLRLTN